MPKNFILNYERLKTTKKSNPTKFAGQSHSYILFIYFTYFHTLKGQKASQRGVVLQNISNIIFEGGRISYGRNGRRKVVHFTCAVGPGDEIINICFSATCGNTYFNVMITA